MRRFGLLVAVLGLLVAGCGTFGGSRPPAVDITGHWTGRWLGYGTVRVLTAADESNLHYTFMRKPLEFRKAILDAKLLFEKQDSRDIAEALTHAAIEPLLDGDERLHQLV